MFCFVTVGKRDVSDVTVGKRDVTVGKRDVSDVTVGKRDISDVTVGKRGVSDVTVGKCDVTVAQQYMVQSFWCVIYTFILYMFDLNCFSQRVETYLLPPLWWNAFR